MFGKSIPELNKKLEDFRAYFLNQSNLFVSQVKMSTERFTDQDRIDFDALLAEIRQFALSKIIGFINTRIHSKSMTFTSFFDDFDKNTDGLSRDLDVYKTQLQQAAIKLKAKQVQSQTLLQRVTQRHAYLQTLKKGFRAFKTNAQQKLRDKKVQMKMKSIYETKLLKKSFFPWRTLIYKGGYQNTVKRQSQVEFKKIHSQFTNIIDVLKQKIMQAQQMIKIKRAAKSQFAYALSKNLLKTISNLSMQVMSLNQATSKDKQNQHQTQYYLTQVDNAIKTRLQTVAMHRHSLYQPQNPQQQKRTIQIQQPRQIPQRILSPQHKSSRSRSSKRISFA